MGEDMRDFGESPMSWAAQKAYFEIAVLTMAIQRSSRPVHALKVMTAEQFVAKSFGVVEGESDGEFLLRMHSDILRTSKSSVIAKLIGLYDAHSAPRK